MTNFARYNAIIIDAFPALKSRWDDETGIYGKTSLLADYANNAIVKVNWNELQRCYEVIDRVIREDPDDEVLNAVCVSFIEHLDFHSDPVRGKKAKSMLPKALLNEWLKLEAYWKSLRN